MRDPNYVYKILEVKSHHNLRSCTQSRWGAYTRIVHKEAGIVNAVLEFCLTHYITQWTTRKVCQLPKIMRGEKQLIVWYNKKIFGLCTNSWHKSFKNPWNFLNGRTAFVMLMRLLQVRASNGFWGGEEEERLRSITMTNDLVNHAY